MKREIPPAALLLPADAPAQLSLEMVVQCLDASGCHTLALAAALSHLGTRPVVLVLAQEQVSFHTPQLPRARRGLQQQALAFAVEPALAQPLEAVHLATGQALAEGRWLVAAMDRALLAGWCGQLAAGGLRLAAIHVDADLLPGQGLRGVHLADRCLLADDQGLRLAFPPALWPQIRDQLDGPVQWLESPVQLDTVSVAPVSASLPPVFASALLPVLLPQRATALDLAQGAFAVRRPGSARRWRPLAAALAAGLLLHLGSVLVQGLLYGKQAQMYQQANQELFGAVAGDQRVVDLRQQFDTLRAQQLASRDVLAMLERINQQLSLPLQALAYQSQSGKLLLTPRDSAGLGAAQVAEQLQQAGIPAVASASGWPLQVEVRQ